MQIMRRGAPQEIITPDKAILPDHAVEVNPFNVYDEFEHFMERPNMFSVEPLIKKLVSEAYPEHEDASSYFVHGFGSGRRIQDEVSKFPVFPLSKMQDFDELLVDMVLDWSYPMPKYSFGPQSELHGLIVRSDSEFAHNALVSHITLPFPREHRSAWDGPDEMQYKGRLIGDLFEAATYHGTPDINPLAARSLVEVYKSTKPGGFTYEWAKEQEAAMTDEQKRYRGHGPSTDNLRELQDGMLARFMSYPHESFDELVWDTLNNEPTDDKRLFTVVNTLLRGRLRKRSDTYYADIADKVIVPYDEEAAELVKECVSQAWRRGDEADASRTETNRALSRRLIDVELWRSAASDNSSNFRTSALLKFAVGMHPLDTLHLEFETGKKSEWVRSPNYYEDLSYMLGLVNGPNTDSVRTTAAWRIAESFEHDYSYDDKPQRAKAVYMVMADAVLSANPNDYVNASENAADSVMDAMSSILNKVPLAIDRMTDDDIMRLMTYRAAYNEYLKDLYPGGADYRPPQGSSDDVWNQYHNATRLHNDFERMARQFGDRLEWQEIQTNPKRYAEYMHASTRNFSDRFNWDVERNGSHTRDEAHRFNSAMKIQTMKAESILKRSEAGDDVEEEMVRFVGECFALRRDYSRTDLSYNSEFHLEFSKFIYGIEGNMPLRMQGIALKLIKSGEMVDFIRDENKVRINKKLARAKIIV